MLLLCQHIIYIYKSYHAISRAGVIPVLCGILYGMFQKTMSFRIMEYYAERQEYKYVYRFPLLSMQESFSTLAVLLVMVGYILIICLLKKYIKLFVNNEYKKRAYFFYYVWIASMLGVILELLPFQTNIYGGTPFATNEGFVVVIPIILILLLGKDCIYRGKSTSP